MLNSLVLQIVKERERIWKKKLYRATGGRVNYQYGMKVVHISQYLVDWDREVEI